MAVLNQAYGLVAKGRNVLVLDMDLEAPGLSGFMSRQKEIAEFARHDMVDLLLWAKQTAQRVSEEAPLDPNSLPPLSDYTVRVLPEKLESLPHKSWDLGRLDVIPIDETRDYYNRLSEVAVAGMDRDTLLRVGSLLRSWLKSRRIPLEIPDYYGPVPDEDRSAPYDYVLIDSRTGITEVGGLCIGPLSDQLVVLCGLNDQNIEGTRQFLTEVGVLKPSSDTAVPLGKPTLFVASPLPIGEMTTKSERIERLVKALGPIKPKLYKLSYHPQMALVETIFVRDHQDEHLAQEYRSLLEQLLQRTETTPDFDPTIFFSSTNSEKTLTDQARKSVRALLHSASISESASMLFFAFVSNSDLKTVTDDIDFQLMDRICRAVASSESSVQFGALDRWSDVLSQWGLRTTDRALKARRFEEAINQLDRIIDSPRASPKTRAEALVNRAVTFGQQGNPEREISDYTAVIEMPDAPAEQKAKALVNRAFMFGQQGNPEREISDYTAVIEMPDAPAEQKAKALVNRAFMFGQQGNPEREISDYTAVIEMPDAPAEQKATALIKRGETFRQQGNPERAIRHFTSVINMLDAPTEQKATALIRRGETFRQQGNPKRAIRDFTSVINIVDAPTEHKDNADSIRKDAYEQVGIQAEANSLNDRGWGRYVDGRIKEAIADLRQAVELDPMNVKALGNLAISLLVDHQTNDALAAYDAAIELADTDRLADFEKDLQRAIAKHGALPGADEVRTRIEARAATLKTTVAAQ